jgi:GWxTD domain-containing protein
VDEGFAVLYRNFRIGGHSGTCSEELTILAVRNLTFLTWLDQDVRWIISAEERSAYMALPSDAERLQFIKEFWQRRNPDPTSPENKFKEEHYRRIAYSNTHFATTHPGWMTDRGRTYIVYGKPDSIDVYPSGERGDARPTEVWHYRTLLGQNFSAGQSGLDVKFVDNCKCGDYQFDSPSKF